MKWLLTAIILIQAPFLFIVFVMAGTDGKRESLYSVWLLVVPLAICSLMALVNVFIRSEWRAIEWGVAAIACLPTLLILGRWIVR
ncbi:MAG: hypothetical protein AB7P20_21580 [Rhizobiaceae bacterium]